MVCSDTGSPSLLQFNVPSVCRMVFLSFPLFVFFGIVCLLLKSLWKSKLHKWKMSIFLDFSWSTQGGPKERNGEPEILNRMVYKSLQDHTRSRRSWQYPLRARRLKSKKSLFFGFWPIVAEDSGSVVIEQEMLYLLIWLGSLESR